MNDENKFLSSKTITEYVIKISVWDIQHGYILFILLSNLIIDFESPEQMLIDIIIAFLEFFGYIIP